MSEAAEAALADVRQRVDACHQLLAQQLVEIDLFDSHSTNLAHRMYDSALACRMRPFADGVRALPRMVRDVGRTLGKQVHLEIIGDATQVDRDILEKLDAPLGHLLRNAVDHGIEQPEERLAAGKPAEGVVRLEARHSAGQLHDHRERRRPRHRPREGCARRSSSASSPTRRSPRSSATPSCSSSCSCPASR